MNLPAVYELLPSLLPGLNAGSQINARVSIKHQVVFVYGILPIIILSIRHRGKECLNEILQGRLIREILYVYTYHMYHGVWCRIFFWLDILCFCWCHLLYFHASHIAVCRVWNGLVHICWCDQLTLWNQHTWDHHHG